MLLFAVLCRPRPITAFRMRGRDSIKTKRPKRKHASKRKPQKCESKCCSFRLFKKFVFIFHYLSFYVPPKLLSLIAFPMTVNCVLCWSIKLYCKDLHKFHSIKNSFSKSQMSKYGPQPTTITTASIWYIPAERKYLIYHFIFHLLS